MHLPGPTARSQVEQYKPPPLVKVASVQKPVLVSPTASTHGPLRPAGRPRRGPSRDEKNIVIFFWAALAGKKRSNACALAGSNALIIQHK